MAKKQRNATKKASGLSGVFSLLSKVRAAAVGSAADEGGAGEEVRVDDQAQVEEQPQVQLPEQISAGNVPSHLAKYWAQRHRLFSLFSDGILMDEQSWYSVTPEAIALQIAERCRCDTVVDAFCGVGGNAIGFAFTCVNVVAIDIDPVKIAMAKHNARIYGVEDRITFICADFLEWIKAPTVSSIDVMFLSPPWGGIDYLSTAAEYTLDSLVPVTGKALIEICRPLTENISMFLPKNTSLTELSALTPPEQIMEAEEQWMSGKLKAITVYWGKDLVGNAS